MSNTRRPEMSIAEACRILGVTPDMAWHDIRVEYRQRIRATHPDVDHRGDATARAARLNLAYQVLEDASGSGSRKLPHDTAAGSFPVADDHTAPLVLRTRSGDVFVQLLEAAYALGEVSYIDPEAGLIQLLLTDGGPAASQLLIAIDVDADPVSASFTLDSMDEANAPDIHDVVSRLGLALAAVER